MLIKICHSLDLEFIHNFFLLHPQSVVKRHSSRKEEEEKKMMIMQRILTYGTLHRVAVVRPMLAGVTIHEPPVAFYCSALRLSPPPPTGRRWLSTSASSKAAHQPKHQPPEEEPQSSSAPQTQAAQREEAGPEAVELDPLQDKSIGLVQRFKRTFKQYGKVMIPVHLLTSSVWFGTFYYAAMK